MGRLLFYLLWPAFWFYTPLTRRARVVVMRGDEILLVRNRLGPSAWQLPGGGIKFGESVQDAASRELFEELNIVSKNTRVLNKEPVLCQQFGLLFRLHFVSVEVQKPVEIVMQKSEIKSFEWMKITELSGVAREVKTALKLVETLV